MQKQFSPDGAHIVEEVDHPELGKRFICSHGRAWTEEEVIVDDACPDCGRRLIDCRTRCETLPAGVE